MSSPTLDPQRPTPARKWAFRLLAVGLALLPFLAAELICRLAGWGIRALDEDPFAGFSAVQPLFELDPQRGEYRIASSRLKFFAPDSFPAAKSPRTFRIFCLGGSTVQGHPYSKETSFTTWLRLALNVADRRHDWEVINCGGVSYASYRLVPILEECLQHQPDLFIVCTGHNEFLEDRTYGHLKQPSRFFARPARVLCQLRIVALCRQLVRGEASPPSASTETARCLLPAETDPILDYHDSLRVYHRDDEWQQGVVAHYGYNIRKLIDLSQAAHVPLLLMLPPSNLGDSPPFKSELRNDLRENDLARWKELKTAAGQESRRNVERAAELLRAALQLDDRHAATWYDLGQCERALGRISEARKAFVQARDHDICPLRMISPLEAALRTAAAESNVPLLDAHALLEAECADGILGDWMLVDHVHPSFKGYQLIANALVEELGRMQLATLATDWRPRAEASYQRHFESLDRLYFQRGLRTLEAVRGWTRGEADGPPAEGRFPGRVREE